MYAIKIKLLSDTTFGRGDGVAGLIDSEVEHDRYGFPYLRGRTLKGLLSEECDNLVILIPESQRQRWLEARNTLFGEPGSTDKTMAKMHVGDACLPSDLREEVAFQLQKEEDKKRKDQCYKPSVTSTDILASLTAIRQQTAIDPEDGAPAEHSLRSFRVVIRDPVDAAPSFEAPLFFDENPTPEMLALLGVGTLALRRIGSGRNRGRGHVQCTLHYRDKSKNINEDITRKFINCFEVLK
ncbi:RAMP superfamily CRISPR-associated protein [Argonema antarcticum]|uniref:RAMP superfamily CRISPR-associated protein n=1 Tax=Argonema antarcticum TaxID=2942763 RepID=UPI0020131C12|nr:RAMP superfamily CRISPR-associated protein [Argonema antarcticum]MCL1473244.1 RAMP superfamily CRISPR-associated protein [Argonema antarcticum A004/B2]